MLYSDLHIVIIDEISMVDHNLLGYVHGRLRQIKQTGDYYLFGKVNVIAVGDFFQLPPVRGKPLFIQNAPLDLWNAVFKLPELNTVVRQKDTSFAEILNRLCTCNKGFPLSAHVLNMLKSRETGESSDAVYIFPTNTQVEEHNIKQIIACCPDHVSVEAQDFFFGKKINQQTGQMQLKKGTLF